MKIGIDISQSVFKGAGVALYTKYLITNLLKIDKKNEYVLFGTSFRFHQELENFYRSLQAKNCKKSFFKIPHPLFELTWNHLHQLPIEAFTQKLDVFHTSDWFEPPSNCPKVTTIHDLVVYKYPQTLPCRTILNHRRKLEWVKKESALIITDSQSTKQDIIDILKIPERKIKVIYPGCALRYNVNQKQATSNIREMYKIKEDYILSVGTREPRKNLQRLIQAFVLLKNELPNLSLVIVGKYGWGKDIDNFKFKSSSWQTNIKLLGYVPKEELFSLYSGAECFVYPSLYEGFGLPILEAMASGCPVVTSNVSSMPEVAGKAAVLVNPESIEDISSGIKRALNEREELIKKGKQRAKNFSWEKTAEETLSVYLEAAHSL